MPPLRVLGPPEVGPHGKPLAQGLAHRGHSVHMRFLYFICLGVSLSVIYPITVRQTRGAGPPPESL